MAELIGLDVGFSASRPSSGIARLRDSGEVRVDNCYHSREKRIRVIGESPAQVVAIDAPVTLDSPQTRRSCEQMTKCGKFRGRCEPGYTHYGQGLMLRKAGRESVEQLQGLSACASLVAEFPRMIEGRNVVEAFPNGFLGVALADSLYASMPQLKRGKKFDWLYDTWARNGFFSSLMEEVNVGEQHELLKRCEEESQHDKRAALVCVLTAACVSAGRYTAVGDKQGGYFFLPPWECWSEWARKEIDQQRRKLEEALIWIDGRKYGQDSSLPAKAS